MTTDWRDLPAGLELDALVSERVFVLSVGTPCEGGIGELPNSPDGWFCYECKHRGKWGESPYPHPRAALPYSTDIAAAWRVVERLRSLERVTAITAYLKLTEVQIFRFGQAVALDQADTTPLAICRAALMAVEVRDE